MVVRVLDIVDMQVDFMKASGKLAVPGAEALIERTNEYFRSVKKGDFAVALFKYDTHFAVEYPHSPESQSFPDIHCEYGTPGWQLAVDDSALQGKVPVYYMSKNTFDMWADNPVSKLSTLTFDNPDDRDAYKNLYHATQDRAARSGGYMREAFMELVADMENMEVTVIGVASDFCVHDAILGYLQRGATVKVVEDLVTGIGTPVPGRAESGHIRDVLKLPPFRPYVEAGKVTLTRFQP